MRQFALYSKCAVLVIATATDPRAVEDDGPHGIPH